MIEWSQKNKIPVEFRLVESFVDENNNPIFITSVFVYNVECGKGKGFSKKESQQKAAEEAYHKIGYEKDFVKDILILKEKEDADAAKESEEENTPTERDPSDQPS